MPFVPCPPPFDVPCFGPEPINISEDQFVDEELIFFTSLPYGDSYDIINQPSLNFDIPLIDPLPINQVLGQPWP